jgi:hypothetical protein
LWGYSAWVSTASSKTVALEATVRFWRKSDGDCLTVFAIAVLAAASGRPERWPMGFRLAAPVVMSWP